MHTSHRSCGTMTRTSSYNSSAATRALMAAVSTCWPGPRTRAFSTGRCSGSHVVSLKASSYIAQYPVFRTAQSAFNFTSLAGLFKQTQSQHLWEASSHATINARRLRVQISTTVYSQRSFIQLSKLEQYTVQKLAKSFTRQRRF